MCVGFGLLPSNEIARSLGCRHSYDEVRGCLTVDHAADGRTSVAGVRVVGDGAGVAGAKVAQAAGLLAGAAAAQECGHQLPGRLHHEVAQAERCAGAPNASRRPCGASTARPCWSTSSRSPRRSPAAARA